MKLWVLAAILAALSLATPALAAPADRLAAQVGARYKDQRYDVVRKALIAQGFRPIIQKHRPYLWPCGGVYYDYCTRYPEIYDCSSSGIQKCWLTWRGPEHSGCFLLETSGEDKKTFTRIRPMQRKELADIHKGIQEIYDDPTCHTRLCFPNSGVSFEALAAFPPGTFVIPKFAGKGLCK